MFVILMVWVADGLNDNVDVPGWLYGVLVLTMLVSWMLTAMVRD